MQQDKERVRGSRMALKVYKTEKRPASHDLATGTICTDAKSYVDVAVEDGYIRFQTLQLAGKKRMEIKDFLNGFKQIGDYTVE